MCTCNAIRSVAGIFSCDRSIPVISSTDVTPALTHALAVVSNDVCTARSPAFCSWSAKANAGKLDILRSNLTK